MTYLATSIYRCFNLLGICIINWRENLIIDLLATEQRGNDLKTAYGGLNLGKSLKCISKRQYFILINLDCRDKKLTPSSQGSEIDKAI
jgi:hypothetical protein